MTQKIKGPNNPDGAMYKVRWGGQDAGGRPYGAKDDTWEAINHSEDGNLSRVLHFNRILNELCERNGTPLRDVQAGRYNPNTAATTGDDEDQIMAGANGSSSEDDAGSELDGTSDGDASDVEEQSGGSVAESSGGSSSDSNNDSDDALYD